MESVKENRRAHMTKIRLKKALIKLRQNKPLRCVTVKELCTLADVSRSTFYLHYDSPEEVFYEIEDTALSRRETALAKSQYAKGSTEYWLIFLDNIEQYPDIYYILFTQTEEKKFKERIRETYINAVPIKFLNNEDKNNLVINYTIAGNIAILVSWIKSGCKMPQKELANLRFAIFGKIRTLTDEDTKWDEKRSA